LPGLVAKTLGQRMRAASVDSDLHSDEHRVVDEQLGGAVRLR
jgi:hypothetical protein